METNEQQPKQIYDLDSGVMVENPALKAPEPKKEPEQEEEEEEEELKKEKPKEEKEPEGKETKKEEPESEEEEEEEPEEYSPDDYIKSVFDEKYDLKTEKDVIDTIENALDLQDEFESLQANYNDLKKNYDAIKSDSGKPKFASDKEEKAFEFIKKFDVNRQGEGLETYAKLIAMDVDGSDGRMIMEEQFIHQNPELTRGEAIKKFNRDYNRKYVLEREKFDGSDEQYTEEMEMLKIDMKSDIAKAKNYLKDQQTKYKPKADEEVQANDTVAKSIKKIAPEYESFAKEQNQVVFGSGEDKFTFVLDADQQKHVTEAMNNWVKNPNSYDAEGNLTGIKNPKQMFNTLVGAMYMDAIINVVKSQVKNKTTIQRVDEIGKVTPKKRKSPEHGDLSVNKDDLDAQAELIIKKRRAA